MDYTNVPGLAAAGMAGLMIGAAFGRKMSSDLMIKLEARLASAEKQFASISAGVTAAETGAADAKKYASAIEKMASAIERHADAIDDHGAATVAAAVESHAALEPVNHSVMTAESPIA
jgi:hypothetical protein